ncbi:Flavohemoprotein (Hemoglobin-like protein) (Flavohemoglobin) (Nitric oxide dioxygenase) [hydrothermal vent metagenome]|uniref:Flavohemoprotein (Hemoglobin-like protein) (Flavohemoglobin) (Nitric oxide dioxygenase) n=1 Tax=hydrothermal vent metagenome TaxID=652676 RepID=A0A1W1BE33_9ZZZZ
MTEETKAIIKSTAPVLKEHGEAITQAMYTNLFAAHPEAKDLFKNAAPDQYKKLANAVYAYAANIDNLGALGKGIEQMVSVHVKSDIQAHHYPWVGEALLAAIKQVLGDAATDDVINAWSDAYTFLAGVLIAKEKEAYQA